MKCTYSLKDDKSIRTLLYMKTHPNVLFNFTEDGLVYPVYDYFFDEEGNLFYQYGGKTKKSLIDILAYQNLPTRII